ncbi:MAG: efflux RND transporter periplasmic adaptor subunit [Ignavibacteria bacterium]|nr:efflux RND transporter periplasmic adaptor subunit [Ignavibacteria bacterium]
MNKKINIFKEYFLILPIFLLLISCSSKVKNETKISKNELKKVPVKVVNITTKRFEKFISFYSKLMGRVENTKTSMVSDRIEKIFVRAGQYVKEGQVVLQFPINNPNLQYQQAKLAYENALKTYNRFKELLKTGETSQQNFDNVETQFLVAKRNYEALKQILFVEAPISGYVASVYVTEGQQVDIGKPLFTISVLDKVRAVAWANEQEVLHFRLGMPGNIIWSGKEYPCKIISLAMKMDDAMKGFRVEFEAPNPKLELKSGVTAEIRVKIYENPEAIVVPKSLVEKDIEGKNYVFVVENGKAKKRYVEIGNISGVEVEIIKGLKNGDLLVIEGSHLLDEELEVEVVN